MADLVSPIVYIISRLWPCCAKHTRYLCKLQENKILLRNAMDELKETRDDVQARVVEAEADLNEPKKKRTAEVSGWLQRVEKIEGEVEVILNKAGEQLSRARCVGGVCCCPPNNCWSNYKVGKSIAKKIPLVDVLKVNGKFEEVTHVARDTNYLCKLQDNKILLRNAMDELKNVRNDVQRKVVEAEADQSEPKKRLDSVSGWLQSVENIEGEVEVILQTSDEQLSNNARSCHEKDKLVVMKKAYVDELKEKGHFEELTYRLPPSPVEDMNLESIVGMESMFHKVWKLIINSTSPVSNIIGLYGTGGVGKTTLLEKINNEFHNKISTGEQHGFDDYVVIFVVVSKPVNYEAIQNTIGERLGLSNSLQGDGAEKSRAQKIFNVLRKKKYVLLLDDIWEDQFDKKRIGIPMHPQGNSKLIFTTRSERVCGLMEATHTFQVECLPWDKAWSLFQDKVGEKTLNYLSGGGGGALELAKDVAKECGGLPLALITIGRAMSTKKSVQEWRDAKTTLRRYASKFKDMRDKVLPRLKMSYDNLSDETEKSCFRYCALFPEDYSIEIAQLVDYWIAEGFLDGFDNNLDEARNRGHTIIGSLKSACLLESSDEENSVKMRTGEHHVKMHDVIRDLALWIVNDCRSSSDGSGSSNNLDNTFFVAVDEFSCKKWENAERIFWIMGSSSRSNEEENPPTSSRNLLTLIVQQRHSINNILMPPRFFQHMPLLRVLDLSKGCCLEDGEFPISICELHELQYLNLSETHIKELPVELRKLVKLKFLLLINTVWLRRIPAGLIASLSELQVLDLGCDFDSVSGFDDCEGPSLSELDGLKQLQEVRITIQSDVALEKFLCNRKLQMVCTGLKFEESYKSSSSTRRVLDLSKFKSLKDLDITGFELSDKLQELVILYWGLLSNLERRLTVASFPKLKNIIWMAEAAQPDLLRSHLQSLHHIRIYGCHALKDLTWLVYVENLETLYVWGCKGLETIIIDLLGDDGLEGTGVFRRLKTLYMARLPKLKSICRHALAFPSIENIWITKCPELKKLPLGSRSNINNTLQRINVETKLWNELQWEDETIKSKFLPYFTNKWKYSY